MNGEQAKKDKAVSDLMCNIALADVSKVSVEEFVVNHFFALIVSLQFRNK